VNPAREIRGGPPAPLLTEITDREFALFQSLICREAGIHLADSKKPMLVCRLMRRLNTLKLESFADYYRYVLHEDKEEMVRLLDAVCTNETWFFRNLAHFKFVRDRLCPRWLEDGDTGRRLRRLRAWSAACSSGEEPFSLAMVLLEALPGWEIEIVATDLSSRVLERGRAATWPLEKAGDIPPQYLKTYMLRGTGAQQGKMKAGPEIRRVVSFHRLNLNDELWHWEPEREFELIFCRNVLMYFEPTRRERVLRRILSRLAPRGHLFVGDAETLNGFEGLRLVAPAVHIADTEG
jgi:chemotaxis protein methyltransferase CheR